MPSQVPKSLLIACLVIMLVSLFGLIIHICVSGYTAIDHNLSSLVRSWRNPWLDFPLLTATLLGNWFVMTATFLSIGGMLIYQRRWSLLIAMLTMVAASGAFVSGIKLIVQAVRPDSDLYNQGVSTFSFPSGHTTFSTLLGLWFIWLTIQAIQQRFARNLLILFFAIMIGTVAISRLYLGAHWPTDIATGFVFSSSLMLIFTLSFQHYRLESKPALQVLKLSALVYVLTGIVYVSYKWQAALLMYR